MTTKTESPSPLSSVKRALVESRLRSALRRRGPVQEIRRRTSTGPAPMTGAQRRMWFLEQLEPGMAAYNFPIGHRLEGDLDVAVLEAALVEIVRRHEALRTRFTPAGSSAVQCVDPAPERFLSVIDLSRLDAVCREPEARRLTAAFARRAFDLARGPLFRGSLLALGERESLLLLGFHHIVVDGLSLGVLFRELGALYPAFAAGRPSPLPELLLQYADYAVWQQEQVREHGADLGYWKQQLAGLPVLELPTDRPHPAVRSGRGAGIHFTLPGRLSTELQRLCGEREVSFFVTLLAAYAVVLMRSSGQEDLAIGAPVAERKHAELEGLVGLLLNTLVLRCDLAGDPGFDELLHRIRDVTLDAVAHQVPLEELVTELVPERGLGRSPLYQVMFGLANASAPLFELTDLHSTPVPMATGTAKFEWTLLLEDRRAELAGYLEYDTDLFDATSCQRTAKHFDALLWGIVTDPGRKLSQLPLLSAAEAHQVLVEWPATATPYPRDATLHRLFEARVAAAPDRVAVEHGEDRLSSGELDRRANRLAHHLRALGVRRGVRVGVFLERSTDLFSSLVGILKAGGVYVPLDLGFPAERLVLMLEDAGVSVVVARSAFLQKATSSLTRDLKVVHLDDDRTVLDALPATAPRVEVHATDLAYVIYTSGSTGTPKGVAVPHRAVVRLVMATDYVEIRPDDVMAQASTVTFDAATFEIWGACLHGPRLAVVERDVMLEPRSFAAELARRRITALFLTTALFNQIVRVVPDAFAGLRHLLFGGEMVDPERVREALAAGPPGRLLHVYGPTENTTFSTWHPVDEVAAGAANLPIGKAIAQSDLYVLDRHRSLVPVSTPGELYLGGDGLARGYLERPMPTAASFVPDALSRVPGRRLYRTGDLVRQLAGGVVEFLGRFDHQIKLRGFRIELGEIESVLKLYPGVIDGVVMVLEERLVAFVAGAAEDRPEVASLRAFIERTLPAYMVPSAFMILDTLPLNANGKVDRPALRTLDWQPLSPETERTAPRNSVEETLLGIYSELLKVAAPGIDDSFFELGGHSLMATEVITRVRRAFGVELPLRRLFDAPTVRELSAFVTAPEDRPLAALPRIEPRPRERHEPFPLTDVQQAYWVGRQAAFELGNIGTHIYLELACEELDPGRLGVAWRKLIERHEMLRAVFLPDGEQQILATVPAFEIAVAELSEATAQEELDELRRVMSDEPLRPERWPLFRLRISRLPDGRAHLHLTIDALIADASSLEILFRDLLAFYRDGETVRPALELSFRDYVLAERSLQESDVFARALEYWRARLDDLPGSPELPLASRPEALERPRFKRYQGSLDPADWGRLKEWARSAGLTPSVVLLTAFSEVLACWSKSPRFSLNLTLFQRLPLHPQVGEIVGDFTSLTLLEVDDSGRKSIENRARLIQEQLWDDLDHRYVSGVRVLRELTRRRGAPAAMPVVFTSTLALAGGGQQRTPFEELGEIVDCATQTPQVWLDHHVSEVAGALAFDWDVVEELFPEGMVAEMFGVYRALLQRLTESREAWQEPLPSLIPAHQLELRAQVNATSAPLSAQTLHGLFAAQVDRQSEHPAVISSRRTLSYGELEVCARGVARQVRRGTMVAVVMEKGWEQVAAVLGILRAGAAYLPVDPSYPAARVDYLLEHGQVDIVLTQPWLLDRVSGREGVQVLTLDDGLLAAVGSDVPEPCSRPEDLAYVIYTSGSTGSPKGVMIDHRGAVNTVLDVNQRFGIGPRDRVLALSSLSFDLSVYDIFGTLAAGGAIVMPDSEAARDPAAWGELAARHDVTVWNSVPALMELLVDYLEGRQARPAHRLRLVMLSGDWVPVSLPGRIRGLFESAQVVSLGGATEASIWSILYPIGEVPASWTSVPYGQPMRNQTFHVLDDRWQPCPVWVPGELYIGGAGVALGYWHDKERTAASFVTHPGSGERLYRTGDLGRYLPDGNIEFLGREDFQVKVQGYRVELGEIEASLTSHSAVRASVVAAQGERSARRLVAWFVVHEGVAPPSQAELRDFLSAKLPAYMMPSTFVAIAELPLSANGKVDRSALPDPRAAAAAVSSESVSDESFLRLGKRLLGIEDLALETDLLAMGATSVDIIRLLNEVERELGFRPDLRAFYEQPTLAWLARATPPAAEPRHDPSAASEVSPMITSIDLISDPEQREAFRLSQPGRRPAAPGNVSVELAPLVVDEELGRRFLERRTHRRFVEQALPLPDLNRFLSHLAPLTTEGGEKYLYPSAGSIYGVQTYLHLKPGAVEGLRAGVYYFDPVPSRLELLAPDAELAPRVHEPMLNRPIFEQASLSIFLVARLRAFAPLYGEASWSFALLEAGAMLQVLMSAAPASGLGLCPIGSLDFESVRHLFDLEPTDVLAHSLVGGVPGEDESWSNADSSRSRSDLADPEREEWEL